MNLILQAIKSLFRKVENSIAVNAMNVATLTQKITSAQKTANMTKRDVGALWNAVNNVQNTADEANLKSETAQTTADSATSIAKSKVSFLATTTTFTITDAYDIAVGEFYAIKTSGYMVQEGPFARGTQISICFRMNFESGQSTSYDAILTATGSYDANGILPWYDASSMGNLANANVKVFAVTLKNISSTSSMTLHRIA